MATDESKDRYGGSKQPHGSAAEDLHEDETINQPEPSTDGEGPRTETIPPEIAIPVQVDNRFKLGRKIGEGGFGEVYAGVQVAPVRREVAIKIAKKKFDAQQSKEIASRFKQERQALAILNHENIARIFDGGTAKNGQPYFVMELVKGKPINEFCDEQSLTLEQRMDLFVKVCGAVHHAHQKGIIHRDLKPSNILVSTIDEKAVPKVIDFGLVKVLDRSSTSAVDSVVTQMGIAMGTWNYISPEQAQIDQDDVDVRTDIYSLGIILFELITGTTPMQYHCLKSGRKLDPLTWLKNETAVAPSNCIQEQSNSETNLFSNRNTDPIRLRKRIVGDLDIIVLGAIEKDRNVRYGTVSELADDIRRYLQNEPIRKRVPSISYKVKKFVRKNRTLVGSISLAFVALIVGLIAALVAWSEVTKTKESLKVEFDEKNRANDKLNRTNEQLQQANVTNNKLIRGLKNTESELTEANSGYLKLVEQGSHVSLSRGKEAWHNRSPDRAIAHFANSLRMRPNNDNAMRWMAHSMSSHVQHGFNPPIYIIGGDEDSSKTILSQDGTLVAIQSRIDSSVTIVETATRQLLVHSQTVVGTIGDLHCFCNDSFELFTIDTKNNKGLVWKIKNDSLERVATLEDEIEEGELEFSNGGHFLVRRIEQPKNRLIYRTSSGKRETFEAGSPDIGFYLSHDDSIMVAWQNDKFVGKRTNDFSLVDLQVPDFRPALDSGEAMPAVEEAAPQPPLPDNEDDKLPVALFRSSLSAKGDYVSADNGPAKSNERSLPTTHPNSHEMDPVIFGVLPSSLKNLTITNGKLHSRSAGALLTVTPFATEKNRSDLFLSFHKLGNRHTEVFKIQAPVNSLDYLESARDAKNDQRFRIFVTDENRWMTSSYIAAGSGGCGPGVDCMKPRYDLKLFWNNQIYEHSKPPRINIHQAIIDKSAPRALLTSRPIPMPQLELFDFSSQDKEPILLTVPAAERPTNELQAHFVAGTDLVICQFAKNAVGIWDCAPSGPNTETVSPSRMVRINQVAVAKPAPPVGDAPPTPSSPLRIKSRDGISYEYRTPATAAQPVELIDSTTSNETWQDVGYVASQNSCYLYFWNAGNEGTELELVNPNTFESELRTTIEFADRGIKRLFLDKSGEYLVVEAAAVNPQEYSQQADKPRSVAEEILKTNTLVGVYSINDKQWKFEGNSGQFLDFDPTGPDLLIKRDDGNLVILNPQSVTSSVVPKQDEIPAQIGCYSEDGSQLAVLDIENKLTIFARTGLTRVSVPVEIIPRNERLIASKIFYDQNAKMVSITDKGNGSYYTNSQGCANCGGLVVPNASISLSRVLVVDLGSRKVRWFRNSVAHFPGSVYTNEENRLVGYLNLNKAIFGAVPFNRGQLYVSPDQSKAITISRTDLGNSISTQPQLEFWDLLKDRPLAKTVVLPPSNINSNPFPIIAAHFDRDRVRMFFAADTGHIKYFDHEFYADSQNDSKLESNSYQWFWAYAGKSVDLNDGRIFNLTLPSRTSALSNSEPVLTISNTYRMIRDDQTRKTDYPLSRTNFAISVLDSNKSINEKRSPPVKKTGSLEKMRVQEGFVYKEASGIGKLLRVDDSHWIQISNSQSVEYHYVEIERKNGHVQLRDEIRELEIKIPIDGGNTFIRSTYLDRSSKWKKWKSITALTIVN